jgi:hypothetical protein
MSTNQNISAHINIAATNQRQQRGKPNKQQLTTKASASRLSTSDIAEAQSFKKPNNRGSVLGCSPDVSPDVEL